MYVYNDCYSNVGSNIFQVSTVNTTTSISQSFLLHPTTSIVIEEEISDLSNSNSAGPFSTLTKLLRNDHDVTFLVIACMTLPKFMCCSRGIVNSIIQLFWSAFCLFSKHKVI